MRVRVLRQIVLALGLACLAARGLAEDAPAGRQLFRTKCGMCHLEGGTGSFMLSRRLGKDRSLLEQRTDLVPDYVRQVVRGGLMSMPRFSRVELTDAQLQAVAGYLARQR